MDNDVSFVGPTRRPLPWWLQLPIALAASALGAAVGAVCGAYVYRAISPATGCGQIGCWDFLLGSAVGGVAGLVGGPIAALWALRRSADRSR